MERKTSTWATEHEAHEQMEFHDGWANCAEQLADYLAALQV